MHRASRAVVSIAWLTLLCGTRLLVADHFGEQGDCTPTDRQRQTNDFYVTVSSAEGAVGDYVPVEVSLSVDALHGKAQFLDVFLCFDWEMAELYEPVVESALIPELTDWVWSAGRTASPAGCRPPCVVGLVFATLVDAGAFEALFPSEAPVPLFTAYFRLKGEPGDSFSVTPCDEVFHCEHNQVGYEEEGQEHVIYHHSDRHESGTIRIVDGPPTNPEPPPLPPVAKVYRYEEPEVLFELSGGLASVGQAEVPLELYITSNLEFSGYSAAARFPSDLLSIRRIEQHGRRGIVRVDVDEGFFAAAVVAPDRRRLAQENERFHAATIYVDVEAETSAQAAVNLETVVIVTEENGNRGRTAYENWVAISSWGPDEAIAETRSEPLLIADGLLEIRPRTAAIGDANHDGAVHIADAITILDYLFRGRASLPCFEAAEINGDGETNVSDVVALLDFLFVGGPPIRDGVADCLATSAGGA